MRTFWKYVKAAFLFQPSPVLPPISWLFLAVVALAFFHTAFVWVGLGLEAIYLFLVSTSERFQRYVDAKNLLAQRQDTQKQVREAVAQLPEAERARYLRLEEACREIVAESGKGNAPGSILALDYPEINRSLAHLAWLYLRLLKARCGMRQALDKIAPDGRSHLEPRARSLEAQLADEALSPDVRNSLSAQLDVMRKRLETHAQAHDRLRHIDAELGRIEEQVALVREQAALSAEPAAVATKVDAISATLEGTHNWIREQHRVFGALDEDLAEPPALFPPEAAKETQ